MVGLLLVSDIALPCLCGKLVLMTELLDSFIDKIHRERLMMLIVMTRPNLVFGSAAAKESKWKIVKNKKDGENSVIRTMPLIITTHYMTDRTTYMYIKKENLVSLHTIWHLNNTNLYTI